MFVFVQIYTEFCWLIDLRTFISLEILLKYSFEGDLVDINDRLETMEVRNSL